MSARTNTGTARVAAAGGALALAAAAALAGAGTAQAATGGASAQDAAFLAATHQGNLAEITSGTIAQSKDAGGDIKAEGRLWITDHTALDATGGALAKKYGVTLPAAPNAMQRAAAAGERARNGAAFDAYWVQVGLTGHISTLATVKKEIASGSAPDVVAAATAAEPVVAAHLAHLERLAGEYGVSVPGSVSAGTGGQAAASPWSQAGLPLAGVGVVVAGAGGWVLRRRSRGDARA